MAQLRFDTMHGLAVIEPFPNICQRKFHKKKLLHLHLWFEDVDLLTRHMSVRNKISKIEVLTGEKQNTTCKFWQVLFIKYSMTSSLFRVLFGFSLFIIGVSSCMISAWSSFVNRFEITPDDKILLRYSKKASSLISKSVKMNVVPFPWQPHDLYSTFRSSRKLPILYDLVSVIWNVLYPAMNEESFVKDCFPLPPTPEILPKNINYSLWNNLENSITYFTL